jgi:hypothetical protein
MMRLPIQFDTTRRCLFIVIAAMASGGGSAASAAATKAAASQAAPVAVLETLPVQGNVYLIGGGGANVTALVGDDGVLVVDTGDGTATDSLLAELRKLSPKKINHIITTTANRDRIGGNAALSAAGFNPALNTDGTLATGGFQGFGSSGSEQQDKRAFIHGHENAMLEMSKTADSPKPIKQDIGRPDFPDLGSITTVRPLGDSCRSAISTGDVVFSKSFSCASDILNLIPVIDAKKAQLGAERTMIIIPLYSESIRKVAPHHTCPWSYE